MSRGTSNHKVTNPVLAKIGPVMISSEWTIEEGRTVSEISFLLLARRFPLLFGCQHIVHATPAQPLVNGTDTLCVCDRLSRAITKMAASLGAAPSSASARTSARNKPVSL